MKCPFVNISDFFLKAYEIIIEVLQNRENGIVIGQLSDPETVYLKKKYKKTVRIK